MNLPTPLPRCSKCGGTTTENFQTATSYGVRCLACGHELRHELPMEERNPTVYKLERKDSDFQSF